MSSNKRRDYRFTLNNFIEEEYQKLINIECKYIILGKEMINDGETGLLVEPANPDEMAQKIIYLLKNKNLAEQFSRQTQNDVLENFDLEKMIRETEKIYRE